MNLRTMGTALVAFVITGGLIIGAVGAAGLVAGSGTQATTPSDVTPGSFDVGPMLAQPVDHSGSIAVTDAPAKTIVVDVSHGNDVSRESLQPFVDALTRAGHSVKFVGGGSSSSIGLSSSSSPSALETSLTDADALVIANPATTYTSDEIDSIRTFADAGGRVLLLADTPTQASSATSILGLSTGTTSAGSGQPNDVAANFSMTFGSGYLYNMAENANNFQMTFGSSTGSHQITQGVDRTVFQAAVPITSGDEPTSLVSIDGRLSSTRTAGTYSVVARSGNVAAIGDTWIFSSEGATVDDNEQLVGNVASFLVTGEKTPGVPSFGSGTTGAGSGFPTTPTGPTTPPTSPSSGNETTTTAG